jgi:hypothetical protein
MDVLVAIHSQLRWLVLLTGLAALAVGAYGWFGAEVLDQAMARSVMLVYVVAITIQVLLGVVIYLTGNWWASPIRQIRLEHPILMLIGLGIAHFAAARARRALSPLAAARTRTLGAGLSLLAVLVGIPWVR